MVPQPNGQIPIQAVVEVISEPTPALFANHVPALASLLRMSLLSGIELTLPTALHLLVDVATTVVDSDRQLVVYEDRRPPGSRLQIAGQMAPSELPDWDTNLLHHWVGRAGKPVLVHSGIADDMDNFLRTLQAQAALAVPLFLEHNWAGSIQLFRREHRPFAVEDAHLLWLLSLLAENHMARIRTVQQLTHLAYTDYLTGLRARGFFEQALEQEVHRALRKSSACGLLLLDLDDFKSVNDRFGHAAGDDVLRQFAHVLARDMRDIDTVARFGGDEFAVILPDVDDSGARFVATRIREAVRAQAFSVPGTNEPLRLGLSIGVALCPADERSPDQLLRAADLALYQAKQRGKDRPFFWHELRKSG